MRNTRNITETFRVFRIWRFMMIARNFVGLETRLLLIVLPVLLTGASTSPDYACQGKVNKAGRNVS